MAKTITVGKAMQILSKSEFGRKKDFVAGAQGMVFTPGELKTIFNGRDINDYVGFNSKARLNACLFPEVSSSAENSDYVYYQISDIKGIIESIGVVSVTFFLAVSKTVGTGKDVIFSVQYSNKEMYYVSNNTTKLMTSAEDPLSASVCRPIAIAHNIREDVFQSYLDGFWGESPIPPPTVITWANFVQLVTDPPGDYMVLTWQDDDKNTNDLDISFTKSTDSATITQALVAKKRMLELRMFFARDENLGKGVHTVRFDLTRQINTDYSIQLFYGIHYLMTNDVVNDPELAEYRLYKGQTEEQELTILVEAVYLNGSRQFFDLSNERP